MLSRIYNTRQPSAAAQQAQQAAQQAQPSAAAAQQAAHQSSPSAIMLNKVRMIRSTRPSLTMKLIINTPAGSGCSSCGR